MNGVVSTPQGTEFISVATYTCNEGYNLVGSSNRSCEANQLWSGVEPVCESK